MKFGKQQICPKFSVGCNLYTVDTYEQGFADALAFVREGCDDCERFQKLEGYLRRKKRNAYHHFKEHSNYPGAALLEMIPKKKFITIDAWVTRLVTEDFQPEKTVVDVDAECMILCECGHCLTRQEAKGTDPWLMDVATLEKRCHQYRGIRREYRSKDV
jgi:hypothetical protein